MRLVNCHNFHDFRQLAKQRLPSPIFNYIDGAAEDEKTYVPRSFPAAPASFCMWGSLPDIPEFKTEPDIARAA